MSLVTRSVKGVRAISNASNNAAFFTNIINNNIIRNFATFLTTKTEVVTQGKATTSRFQQPTPQIAYIVRRNYARDDDDDDDMGEDEEHVMSKREEKRMKKLGSKGKPLPVKMNWSKYAWNYMQGFNQHLAPVVKKEELEKLLAEPMEGFKTFTLIDLRSKYKATEWVIPGAVNIPMRDIIEDDVLSLSRDEFKERYGFDKPEKHTDIICYSDIPEEGDMGGFAFNTAGYPFTYNYRGGVMEWFELKPEQLELQTNQFRQRVRQLQQKRIREAQRRRAPAPEYTPEEQAQIEQYEELENIIYENRKDAKKLD
eukprot:GEZU01001038.1.p1 GENE.GEZU01001038.1~~GEZU01001038.1.p1  ORF type:complete len:312 (-),score=108.44 GEZU01001038.1:248-1183(-)